MVDRIDKKAVNSLIYGISASIRKLFGGGADAVMRIAGPYVVEEFEALGVKFEGKDPQTLSDEVKKQRLNWECVMTYQLRIRAITTRFWLVIAHSGKQL